MREHSEHPAYLSDQLITCIGNKRKLLPLLGRGFAWARQRAGKDLLSIADLFSGSGVVSRYAKHLATYIIANDMERYAEVISRCYLSNSSPELQAAVRADLERTRVKVEQQLREGGIISELYAPANEGDVRAGERAFYTPRNARFLDAARMAISDLPAERQHFLLAPLLSQASRHANTGGVFKGFYKNRAGLGQFGGEGRHALTRILKPIELEFPTLSRFHCSYEVHRMDANALAGQMDRVDLAYIDPPYNQHPYGSNYFMLNLLCEYKRPRAVSAVSGIPRDWNRSRYNKGREALDALMDLLRRAPARLIMLSYNDEGLISRSDLEREIGLLGEWQVIEQAYNAFRASRNLNARSVHVHELLYLIAKQDG